MNSAGQAETTWVSSDEMLSLIIESISEVAWVFDPVLKQVVYVNSSVERLHGFTPEEFLKLPLQNWMTPTAAAKVDQLISEQLPSFMHQGTQPDDLVELELIRKDGSTFCAELSYRAYVHEPHGKVYVLGSTRDITKRKLAEENARKNFAMLQGAMRLVNLGAWKYNVKTNLYSVSPEWLRIYGLEREEFDGTYERIIECIHPNDRDYVERVTQKAFKEKSSFPVDFRIIRKNDGSIRHLSLESQMEFNSEGELEKVYGIVNDVTEKVFLEEKKKESEESYKLFSNLTQEGIAIHRDGIALEVNNKFCEIFGYSKSQIIGNKDSMKMLFHSDDVPVIRQRIKTKDTGRYRIRGISSKGKLLWLETEAKQMLYKGIEARVTFIQDITEKMKALSSLANSEERNCMIVDNMPMACFAFDREGTILSWNREAHKIYGYSPEEAVGKCGLDLIGTEEIKDSIGNVIQGVFDGKTQNSSEWNDKDKWGKLGWRYGNAFPIFNESEEVAYGINMVMDVSELKEAYEELEMHKENLERLVEDRTLQLKNANEDLSSSNQNLYLANQALTAQQAELESTLHDLKETQAQLIISEKMASLGTLTAGVAHEINNPLNFIHGGAMGLQAHFEGSQDISVITPFIDAINEGVQRIARIVGSLNKFSRTKNDASARMSVHQMLDNCITILKGKHNSNLKVEKRYEDTAVDIIGVESELHQAILNVLINAEQAVGEQGEVVLYTSVVGRKMLRIAIQDSGVGIDELELSKVFDPFFTTKGREKYSGLGLYIARTIVEQHQGNIDVRSKLGEGTLVEILLPVNDE